MYGVRKGALKTLREGALPALGAWDAPGDALDVLLSDFGEATFFFEYTEGATAAGTGEVEALVEGSPVSSGDDWHPLEEVLDEAAAVLSGQSLPVPVRTASMLYAGTQKAPGHTVRLGGFERVRVRARETGHAVDPGELVVRVRGSTGGV
jgi:hypothetical protein